MSNCPMNMPLHPTTPTPKRPVSKVEYPFGMDSVEIVQGQSFLTNVEIDNIMADSIADGECTWCEYEFSGDGTDVVLKQQCDFHKEIER